MMGKSMCYIEYIYKLMRVPVLIFEFKRIDPKSYIMSSIRINCIEFTFHLKKKKLLEFYFYNFLWLQIYFLQ